MGNMARRLERDVFSAEDKKKSTVCPNYRQNDFLLAILLFPRRARL
jgi:hypothetical protein